MKIDIDKIGEWLPAIIVAWGIFVASCCLLVFGCVAWEFIKYYTQ